MNVQYTPIKENQMEKNMENQMDTGVIQGFKELELKLGSIVWGLHRASNSDVKE